MQQGSEEAFVHRFADGFNPGGVGGGGGYFGVKRIG